MLNRVLIVALIIISLGWVGIIGYAYTSGNKLPSISEGTSSDGEQKRPELMAELQQVNDELMKTTEEIFAVMDDINGLNNAIVGSMSRSQMAQQSLAEQQRLDQQFSEGTGQTYYSSNYIDEYQIRQERQNIAYYQRQINEKRMVLKELQAKQLMLQEQRNYLLTELAKLGK